MLHIIATSNENMALPRVATKHDLHIEHVVTWEEVLQGRTSQCLQSYKDLTIMRGVAR